MAYLIHINSLPELDQLLEAKKETLTIIDFHAAWCGPCHQIAPYYEQLSRNFRHVAFAKVDVDAVPAVAERYRVTAMPTFVFIKNKIVVDLLRGASAPALNSLIAKHAPTATAGASGSGSASSLLEFLDTTQLTCLNESPEHGIKTILGQKRRNKSDAYLLSDADEQLLLTISFNQAVRVRSLVLTGKVASQAPKKIKLLINKPAVGFEDVEDAEEPEVAQVLTLSEDIVAEGKPITVRFVRFQSVNSLTIFVASNHGGDDETRIDSIDVLGNTIEYVSMLGFH
ncbi:DUF1000-domain-containing protein [Sistotremastrum suecicum HHB10207 ss-3]|uniref:DUF1000-domain-containing protein n=1 Tax=Sistotremastrum suecicum HHB10207 ss-3 TaxID=1314776 RepID=A0A166GX56_9AGAM|nr:DUF1000-domain-containing protein [Sistotremastrum suecicum HHB10207 ss-3]